MLLVIDFIYHKELEDNEVCNTKTLNLCIACLLHVLHGLHGKNTFYNYHRSAYSTGSVRFACSKPFKRRAQESHFPQDFSFTGS